MSFLDGEGKGEGTDFIRDSGRANGDRSAPLTPSDLWRLEGEVRRASEFLVLPDFCPPSNGTDGDPSTVARPRLSLRVLVSRDNSISSSKPLERTMLATGDAGAPIGVLDLGMPRLVGARLKLKTRFLFRLLGSLSRTDGDARGLGVATRDMPAAPRGEILRPAALPTSIGAKPGGGVVRRDAAGGVGAVEPRSRRGPVGWFTDGNEAVVATAELAKARGCAVEEVADGLTGTAAARGPIAGVMGLVAVARRVGELVEVAIGRV